MTYVAGVNPSDVHAAPEFKPGERAEGNDGKIYKYVQYDEGAGSVAAVAGNACYYYAVNGYKNNQVTSDLSDSGELGAGVLQSAPADGEYCWVQIKGPATLNLALAGCAAVIPDVTSKFFQKRPRRHRFNVPAASAAAPAGWLFSWRTSSGQCVNADFMKALNFSLTIPENRQGTLELRGSPQPVRARNGFPPRRRESFPPP